MTNLINPVTRYSADSFPTQEQDQPGQTPEMQPTPDHGEESYVGSGRLQDLRALITGGDSGIGRAVAIAFAREGADVAISYLPEEEQDAQRTCDWIDRAERRSLRAAGDIRSREECRQLIDRVCDEFGGLDVLVLNAGYQKAREGVETLPPDDVQRVVETNFLAPLWLAGAAVPRMQPGASIVVTASIQAFQPSPHLLDYAMTKAALVAFTKALAEELTPKGIRVNAVAPGPIWTPLIPATDGGDNVDEFGRNTPLGRAGQPAELAPAYVFLASPEASYVSGSVVAVTGGTSL